MVALAYDVVREEEKMLLKAAERAGVQLRLVKVGEAVDIEGWEPDVYLIRTLSHNRGIVFAAAVEGNGGVSVNSSTAIAVSWNKAVSLARLRGAGLPVPKTTVLFGEADVEIKGRSIVKAVSGSWGRKVALVSTREELSLLLKSAEGDVLMLQEMVGTGEDIRVFVVGGRAVAAMRRIPPEGDWRSNAARGGKTLPQRVDGELEELAVKAAEAVGALYAGVDILIGERLYVNEVNGIPEFKALTRTTGVDVASHIIQMLLEVKKRG
ncbi:ATP-grasp domain-containing protein [Pyrobaculum neutrophilum]|uniref:Alpha-L-glutamate ligase, RimK family n=1 Tax=Pyrobaculum neutrophilum (strain DSM 2338 / JCM 9278 / NBRC 100436 / V24Sta) TaxID=444157 RepID=B1YAL4_PYRNV|nr:RimK family alpha-L-glutamate ligase [Pyrobaculum neutrophilum]ACB39093.1 alpha-L-glutamate ligase, RimK family [Pyrobaculum neutrophilum V24Sta]